MNYYEVLNISSDADKQQVKRAYFSMVKTHSPDKDPEGFKAVRLAYETLFDEKKRAEYDTYFGASEDIQNELLAARELIRQNKYKEAVDFLTEFSKKTAAPEVIRLNIEALLLYGKPGKAQTLCKTLLAENPQDIETLLLCAKISTSRGHTVRADHYYKDAIAIDSHNPKVWIDYIQYSRQHQPWMLSDIGIRAIQIDQDMFRDNYGMYLHVVCGLIDPEISLFEDAQYNERIMMRAFEKFTEYFIADKNPDEITYQNALGAITHVINEPEYLPHIEKLMSELEKCRHHDSNDKDYIDMYAFMIRQKLHVNERIHDVLADLTGYFISGENDRDAQLSMECYIVMELPAIRKDIKVFRDEYPEYFKLHQQFYLDVLNERKTEFLTTKYFSICKRIMRNPGLFDDMEHEEDNIISADSLEPYVREAPKIGRNDPCPCGSGKKYKKCCG